MRIFRKSYILLLMIILFHSSAFCAPQNQNFNFTYKWNLPSIAIGGFSKDKVSIDNFLKAVAQSKYALNWDGVTKPNPVGTPTPDKLKITENNGKYDFTTDGDLFVYVAARSLDPVKVTLSGTPLTAKYTVPDPNTGADAQKNLTDIIEYHLELGGMKPGIDIKNLPSGQTQPSIEISNNLNNSEIFGSYSAQVSITGSVSDFVPHSYNGQLILSVTTI